MGNIKRYGRGLQSKPLCYETELTGPEWTNGPRAAVFEGTRPAHSELGDFIIIGEGGALYHPNCPASRIQAGDLRLLLGTAAFL